MSDGNNFATRKICTHLKYILIGVTDRMQCDPRGIIHSKALQQHDVYKSNWMATLTQLKLMWSPGFSPFEWRL